MRNGKAKRNGPEKTRVPNHLNKARLTVYHQAKIILRQVINRVDDTRTCAPIKTVIVGGEQLTRSKYDPTILH